MTRRNHTNERYTVDDGKKGATKKSASKAKVARGAASTVYVKDANPKKSKRQLRYEARLKEHKRQEMEERRYNRVAGPGSRAQSDKIDKKEKSQSKVYRRYWWIFLIAAAVCAVIAYFSQGTPIFYPLIIASYTLVFAAIIFEISKIRKARNEEERRSELKMSEKRIKHELEEAKEAREKRALKRFKKRGEVDEDLPFKD